MLGRLVCVSHALMQERLTLLELHVYALTISKYSQLLPLTVSIYPSTLHLIAISLILYVSQAIIK